VRPKRKGRRDRVGQIAIRPAYIRHFANRSWVWAPRFRLVGDGDGVHLPVGPTAAVGSRE
jgi:hypothetical protein